MSKFCRNCGLELPNETAAFCVKCGANQAVSSANNTTQSMNSTQSQRYSQNANSNPDSSYGIRENKPTSIGEWIGWILLCSFLPIIGQIIMLCVSNNESVKNYAKANLIFAVIGVVLMFIAIIFFVIVGVSISEMMYY